MYNNLPFKQNDTTLLITESPHGARRFCKLADSLFTGNGLNILLQ